VPFSIRHIWGAVRTPDSRLPLIATGAVYVAGQTGSVVFPTTAGTIQPSYEGGLSDCFVSKLNAAGNSLLYSTYLGGAGLDLCSGIAIDASSDAYVTGTTYSTNFPLQMALQSNLKGTASAFVAEINPTGSALAYSTYLGGSVLDNGNAIAVDSFGSAYIAGYHRFARLSNHGRRSADGPGRLVQRFCFQAYAGRKWLNAIPL
jgi:hypothetical protein